jgi:hypothetical protein
MKRCEHCGNETHEDSELPITQEWLVANGWPNSSRGLWHVIIGVIIIFNGDMVFVNGYPTDHIRTRGDVRRLCAALGEPLMGGK